MAACECRHVPSPSVVVLQIEIANFVALQRERDPPIPRRGDTPRPGAVARQPVDAPTRRAPHALNFDRGDQHGENSTHSADKVGPDPASIVLLQEAPQAAMTDRSYP